MGLFARVRKQASDLKALQEQALAYAAAQGIGPDGRPLAPDAPRPTIDPAAMLPPASPFVKRTTCASCGASKQLPSVREHLYCDYCGQLVDYDLRQAMAAAMVNPDATAFA